MNISTKLSVSVALLFAGIGIAVGVVFVNRWSSSLEDMVKRQQIETTKQTIMKIDSMLYERLLDIGDIASETQTAQFLLGKQRAEADLIAREMANQSNYSGPWESLRYVDHSGIIRASSQKADIGSNLSSDVSIALFNRALVGTDGYSDIHKNALGSYSILFASSVKDDSQIGKPVIGVVMGNYSVRPIQEILEQITISHVNLLTSKGLEIGSNHRDSVQHEVFANFEHTESFGHIKKERTGTGIFPNLETGVDSLVTYVHEPGYLSYKGNNWIIVLQTPLSDIRSAIISTIIPTSIVFMGIIILGAIAFITVMRRSVLTPITSLSGAVLRIAAGDMTTRVVVHSTDEIGQLGGAFNTMTEKIQTLTRGLEETVHTRTRELEQKIRESEQKSKEYEEMNRLMVGRELKMAELKRELAQVKEQMHTP